MKALLHILLIAICGGGVFFAQQSNVKFTEQKTTFENTVADNKKLDANIKGVEKELADEQAGLATAKSDFDEKTAKLEALVSTEKTMQRQMAESDTVLEEQAGEMAEQQKLLESTKEILEGEAGEGVTLATLPAKIEEIKQNKQDQEKALEELGTLTEAATKDVAKNKSQIADLAARKAKRDEKIRANAKEAVITAVEGDWGFVVIGAGSNVGFTPQTKLLVKRDGVLVGRITPTSIEPSQTIGEIDRDSIAPGASVQVGDRVILAVPANQ